MTVSSNGTEVTVAIPSYNQGQFLGRAISSILSQGVQCEICIADGGSTDNSLDVIDEYKANISWWRSQPDGGQSSAVNEAVSRGNGKYIAWLNSDDILLPEALNTLIEYMDSHSECPVVYGKAVYVDANDKRLGNVYTQPFSIKSLIKRCIVCQPAALIRRSAWESLNGLDESLHMSMDYDFWWRATKEYGSIGYIDNYIAASRIHPETKTKQFRRNHYRESMSIVKKYTGRIPLIWYLKMPWSVWYKAIRK